MRELHVVAVSEDGRSVVLAATRGAARGGFRVVIDERLSAAVRGDRDRAADAAPVAVTPKDIQSRLRAGESVEQIAASAGVPLDKIERYAGPVLSERERVLDQARSGYVSRSRLGASALPLGEAVDRHLADTTGVRPETVTWSARREEAGTWVVEVSYVSQARRRTAAWRYDSARREVTATDSASAQLAHVEPARGSRASADAVVPAPALKRAPQSRRPASEPVRRTAPPAGRAGAARGLAPAARTVAPLAAPGAGRTVAARPDAGRVAQADRAAQTAAARAAQEAASAHAAEAERAAAASRAAQLAAAEHAAAGRRAAHAAAEAQARRQAKAEADADRAAARKAEVTRAAKADRKAKAEADRKAKAAADRKAKAEADRKAKAEADRKAKADADRKAKADDDRKADEAAAAVRAEQEAEQARLAAAAAAPSGPPTLRVVGGGDAPPRRSGPQPPPAAARTVAPRAAGQRASVPGWADVLLSTAPARQAEPVDDED